MENMVETIFSNDFWKGKKILLTGHTGFKGSWLLLWLLKFGADVKGFSLEPKNKNDLFNLIKSDLEKFFPNQLDHEIGDIREINKLKKCVNNYQPDIIFHLAAQALVINGYENPIDTWETNVNGTLNLLESTKQLSKKCSIICITTDKVYKNKNWEFGYRETDELGGNDPYSASKAASEILISSWRNSFASSNFKNLSIASARAGNVIGGGDWSENRIIPDIYRSLYEDREIILRNPDAKRPWQHVLEPLMGYLTLARNLYEKGESYCGAYNFGPKVSNNKSVLDLTKLFLKRWPYDAQSINIKSKTQFHEEKLLHLQIDKAYNHLKWEPKLDFTQTLNMTSIWYTNFYEGKLAFDCCLDNLYSYQKILLEKN